MSHHDADPEVVNAGNRPELGIEYRDIDVPKVGKATVMFFVFTIVMIAITIPIFWLMDGKKGFGFGEIRDGTSQRIPAAPNPLLQSGGPAIQDMHDLKARQENEMSSYGWVNKNKGTVRIPVEEAIKKVSSEGLPETTSGGTANP